MRWGEVSTVPTAIDLFAGAGGATQGLKDAGLRVIGAVESDPWAAKTYGVNHPEVRLFEGDIQKLPLHAWSRTLETDRVDVLKACPPCQGFSSLRGARGGDKRNDLIFQIVRFARKLQPRVVFMENVPGLSRDWRFPLLLDFLRGLNYNVSSGVLCASQFGVPQRRKRFFLVAVKDVHPELGRYVPRSEGVTTVRMAFSQLSVSGDPMHRWRRLTPAVKRRLALIPAEGSRFDLPPDEWLDCHAALKGRHATAAYGRLRWDEPAPTMTTRCTTVSCGRFAHPVENRGISLREAACLQSFPPDYAFEGTHESIERQIGNAVPARMVSSLISMLWEDLCGEPSDGML